MEPRIGKVIWTDALALFGAAGAAGFPVVILVLSVTQPGAKDHALPILGVTLLLALLAASVVGWRIARVRRLFASGRRVPARIVAVNLVRDRGRVEFAYEVDGREFVSWSAVHKTRQVRELRPNQEVEVLVDSSRPSEAIISHLYV
jgi:hypothetical protein